MGSGQGSPLLGEPRQNAHHLGRGRQARHQLRPRGPQGPRHVPPVHAQEPSARLMLRGREDCHLGHVGEAARQPGVEAAGRVSALSGSFLLELQGVDLWVER